MVLERNIFFRIVFSTNNKILPFKQLELSEGTSRALRILNKGREYLTPKPEEDLDSDSAEEHSDIPEQSSESSSGDSSSETSESSCEIYNVDEDEGSEELSSEEETETALTACAPSTPNKVPSNQTVVLGEGISQISESSYQTALASTSSAGPDDVANSMDGYDNIEDDMQQYVNANCSGKWRLNSKHLRKIHIVVSEGKYKKKKYCPYCPFADIKDATMVAKLHRHLQSFHQRELRVSNLRRINLEIEELEGSKEIATS